MSQQATVRDFVIGPEGERLTLESLPNRDAGRWTPLRKARIVFAVDGGLLSFEEACERYGLTIEELTSWQRGIERGGVKGLRATKAVFYRDQWERLSGTLRPPIN